MTTLDPEDVLRVVRDAVGSNLADLRIMEEYDAYYLDRRRERPLPVIYARLNDAVGTRYYIDPKTATIAGQYSARNWVNRWLYHGLHSLDFPWLYKYRPLVGHRGDQPDARRNGVVRHVARSHVARPGSQDRRHHSNPPHLVISAG